MTPGTDAGATACQAPPASGRRSRVPVCPHTPLAVQVAAIARTWPSITSRHTIEPPGDVAGVHRSPPSVVSHRPLPNTNPSEGLANRIPHTAGPVTSNGAVSGATGAGSPRQLAPRFRVRRIDVHGAFAHGAVPRTNASSVETNVTDLAANPIGTGPPDGTLTVDVAADVAGGAGRPAEPPPAPKLVAPQAVSATAASRAPDTSPTRDARNDVFMRSPSPRK